MGVQCTAKRWGGGRGGAVRNESGMGGAAGACNACGCATRGGVQSIGGSGDVQRESGVNVGLAGVQCTAGVQGGRRAACNGVGACRALRACKCGRGVQCERRAACNAVGACNAKGERRAMLWGCAMQNGGSVRCSPGVQCTWGQCAMLSGGVQCKMGAACKARRACGVKWERCAMLWGRAVQNGGTVRCSPGVQCTWGVCNAKGERRAML